MALFTCSVTKTINKCSNETKIQFSRNSIKLKYNALESNKGLVSFFVLESLIFLYIYKNYKNKYNAVLVKFEECVKIFSLYFFGVLLG
jgi:hypothetical protein